MWGDGLCSLPYYGNKQGKQSLPLHFLKVARSSTRSRRKEALLDLVIRKAVLSIVLLLQRLQEGGERLLADQMDRATAPSSTRQTRTQSAVLPMPLHHIVTTTSQSERARSDCDVVVTM